MKNLFNNPLFFVAIAIVVLVVALLAVNHNQDVKIVNKDATRVDTVRSTDPNKRQSSKLANSVSGHESHSSYNSHSHDGHDHSHDRENKVYTVGIPKEIDEALEKRRIPASELKPVVDENGLISLDTKGQFEHVTVAVQQPDGTIVLVEKQIQPIPNK